MQADEIRVKSPLAAARCSASDLLRWTGIGTAASEHTDRIRFATRRVRAGVALVHQGAPFDNLYFVAAGTFKVFQTDTDGYEQVHAFALHGDVVGIDGAHEGCYTAGAVALEDSTVAIVPFRELARLGHDVAAIERLLLHVTGRELARRSATLQVMAAVGSEVRVARFLLQMAHRQAALGYSPRRLLLRMSRRDIASHLGIAHETVSRSLTALSEWGYIKVSYREIELLDEAGLYAFQKATRSPDAVRMPRTAARGWRSAPAAGGPAALRAQ